MTRWLTSACLLSLFSLSALAQGAPPLPYADTTWPSIHAGPRNDDYVPIEVATEFRQKWTALDGSSVLTAAVVGPEGNLYVTTGHGIGTSNLHAFNNEGDLLWESKPWADASDLDYCAILSSPIVDTDGHVYISDCNQLWSFASDGTRRWVIDLPAAPEGSRWQDLDSPVNSFATAFFTQDGSVGGITLFGDVVIVSREDGSLRATVANLPGGPGPDFGDRPVPPGLLEGLVDPDLVEVIWAFIFGRFMESANSPAVHPVSGRIFATGTGMTAERGALYGIDYNPGAGGDLGSIEFATTSNTGPGSGSSPAISPDGTQVYVSDDEGTLFAFSASTGAEVWSAPADAFAGSASVGPDGVVYVLSGAGRAYQPSTGDLLWEAQLQELADELLPLPDAPLTGPIAVTTSLITVTDNVLLFGAYLGYSLPIGENSVPVPVYYAVIPVDATTGTIAGEPYFVRDTMEALMIPIGDADGTVVTTAAAIISTIVQPFAGNVDLPDGLEILAPNLGGLEALAPAKSGSGRGGCSAIPVETEQSAGLSLLLLVGAALTLRWRRHRR